MILEIIVFLPGKIQNENEKFNNIYSCANANTRMDYFGLGEFKSLHAIFFSANEVCLYQ